MSTKQPRVACVLVNWNGRDKSANCLATLRQQTYGALEVVLVDNGSTDGSLDFLRKAYPEVTFVDNHTNEGFAKGCNAGAAVGLNHGAEFVWFLNNDTLVPPDTLTRMMLKAQSDPKVGLVGSVLYYRHAPDVVQAWGGGRISRWTGYQRHFVREAKFGPGAYITFASALVRAETYRELQGIHEGGFLYFEDADFGLRAAKAGWRLAVAEDTAILHDEGGSSIGSRSATMDRISTASGLGFLSRHSPRPAVSMLIFTVLRAGRRIARRDWPALRGVLRGVGDWRAGRTTPYA